MSETGKIKKTAIVLFNLGGPDKLASVRPFLYNLFSDKWIIRAPYLIRKLIAFFISTTRTKLAQENYSFMGGKSPLLEETEKQRLALKIELENRKFSNFELFISMRYWHPFSDEVIEKIKLYDPEEIIYLPLYPQLSSSTTISSFEDFDQKIAKQNIKSKVKKIGCYYDQEDFIKSHVELIKESLKTFDTKDKLRILFSAHSIPEKFVNQGDPYEWQIINSYNAIIKNKEISKHEALLCYQSKVGPIKWLSPSTEDEIEKAAKDGINLLLVPIAFVSEHIETLVELDIEYKKIADDHGIKFERVKALGIDKNYINSLANMIENAFDSDKNILCFGTKLCPEEFKNCICIRK